jgi:hypothetical protein
MLKMGGPMQQARNFAVMTGVNAGVQTLMRRVRKVDDIQNSLVAAFTSGACFSLVSGQGNAAPAVAGATPNPLVGAVTAGVMFALFQGAFYKLGEKFSGPKPDPNTEYDRVKAMLANLGLTVSTHKKKGKKQKTKKKTAHGALPHGGARPACSVVSQPVRSHLSLSSTYPLARCALTTSSSPPLRTCAAPAAPAEVREQPEARLPGRPHHPAVGHAGAAGGQGARGPAPAHPAPHRRVPRQGGPGQGHPAAGGAAAARARVAKPAPSSSS